MHIPTMITKSLLVAALALPLAAQAQYVSGTYTDGDQAPTSLSWNTRSSANVTGSVVGDDLVLTRGSQGNILALNYFTPATGRQLAVGETITVSGSIVYSNAASGASVYVGLFNSAPETRLTGNSTSASDHTSFDTPGAYYGYQSYYTVASNAAGHSIDQRSSNKAFASTTLVGGGNVDDLVSATGASGSSMTFSLSVERTAADTVLISSVYNNNVANLLTYTDSIGATFSFDTLAFFFSSASLNSNGSTITLDNIDVVVTAIPEPSTYALLAGAAMLGLVVLRRRRK